MAAFRGLALSLAMTALACGCEASALPGEVDAGAPSVDAYAPPDMACTRCDGACDYSRDRASCGGCGVACAAAERCIAGGCLAPHAGDVVDQILLPQSPTDFAIDLDGDGRVDNQLSLVLQTLSQTMPMSPAVQLEASIRAGDYLLLVDAPAPGATRPLAIYRAIVDHGVRFDGTDVLSIDQDVTPALCPGSSTNTGYEYFAPIGPHPPTVDLVLTFSPATDPLVIPLSVHHLKIDFADASHLKGVMQGSILRSVFAQELSEGLAAYFNYVLTSNSPTITPATKKALLTFLDNGDGNQGTCMNASGPPGVPGDGVITPCEILASRLGWNLARPDLQVYDASGRFDPRPPSSPAALDSISFGLGFTGVAATIR